MKLNIFCNVSTRRAEATSAGQSLTWPEFTAGDRIKVGIRFLEQIEGTREERNLKIRAARLTLGLIDAAPAGGSFSLKVGSGSSTSANTTPLLLHTISAQSLEATINALSAVSGTPLAPARVTFDSGTYEIAFADGSAPGLVVQGNTLTPRSFGRIRAQTTAGRTVYDLRLMQSPLAQAPLFTRELPPAPAVETVQDGSSDPAGITFVPEIQRLTIPPLFRGSFVLRYGDYQKSPILSTDTDAEALSEALRSLFAPQAYAPEIVPDGDGFLIVFNDKESLGADLAPLVPQVFTAAEGDVTFDLDLNTREVFEALRETNLRRDCVLELEADILDDDDDIEDSGATARTVTLLQAPIVLRRELRWDGLSAAASVDWLRPPEPRDYVPFTLDQVLTGQQQAFAAVVGNGVAVAFTLDHNLASELAHVVVRENSTPGRLLRPSEYEVEITSADSLVITFPTPPALNAYAVHVLTVGPASVFQSHTHTIGQILGLQDILDEYGTRIETLESILPATGPGATSQPSGIEIELPEVREVLFYGGTAKAFGDKGVDAAVLGRGPMMFPAVHDATVTSYTGGALPALAAGQVWSNDSGASIDLGRGVRGGRVAAGGFFASDGRARYAVERSGATNSYFPTGFQRELWRIFVNEKMLRIGRTLDVQFGVALQLLATTSNAQWLLVLEHGTAPSQSTPSTTGTNLENVVWNATPLLSQRLILTPARQLHQAGARVQRTSSGLASDSLLYGVWESATGPSGANFALRARLIQFDTENALAADARGWIAVEVVPPVPSGEGEEQPKAKAVIV